MFCLSVCAPSTFSALRGQRRALDPLELEWQTVVVPYGCRVLWRKAGAPIHWAISSTFAIFSFIARCVDWSQRQVTCVDISVLCDFLITFILRFCPICKVPWDIEAAYTPASQHIQKASQPHEDRTGRSQQPRGSSPLSVTWVPGDLMPSSDLWGHCMQVVHISNRQARLKAATSTTKPGSYSSGSRTVLCREDRNVVTSQATSCLYALSSFCYFAALPLPSWKKMIGNNFKFIYLPISLIHQWVCRVAISHWVKRKPLNQVCAVVLLF